MRTDKDIEAELKSKWRMKYVEVVEFVEVLSFEDWAEAYGVCSDCGVDIMRVDRESWLDDNCHRHKFEGLISYGR